MPLDRMILDEYDQAHWDRLKQFKAAWEAYEGKMPAVLKGINSDPEGKDNIVLSYADVIVDTSTDFLFGKGLEWETDKEKDSEEDTPEEKWLDAFWLQNKKEITLQKISQNGGVTGHPFVKMVKPAPGYDYPRLIVLDSANLRVFSDVEDYEDVFAFAIEWAGIRYEGRKRIGVLRRQVIERNDSKTSWTITDWERVISPFIRLGIMAFPSGSKWLQIRAPEAWPYEWAPIFHCQNLPMANCFWGKPDLTEDILGINHGINFSASNNQRIERIHAHPKLWSRGISGEVDGSIDAMINIPSEKGEIQVLNVPFEGMQESRENMKVKKEALHAKSRTPEIATGKFDTLGQLSGLALSILYGPLLSKTETKRILYGEMLSSLNKRALEIGGKVVDEVRCVWGEMLPKDRKAEAEAYTVEQGLGASKVTILGKLGYDAQEELKKSEAEQNTADARQMKLDSAQFDRGFTR